MKLTENIQRAMYVVSDFILTNIALVCFNIFRYEKIARFEGFSTLSDFLCDRNIVIEQIFIPLFALFIYWLSGYYNTPFQKSRLQELITTITTAFINTFIVYLLFLINDMGIEKSTNYKILALLFTLFFILPYVGRLLLTEFAKRRSTKGDLLFPAVIIGASDKAAKTARDMAAKAKVDGFKVVGFVEIEGENRSSDVKDRIISADRLAEMIRDKEISQFIIITEEPDDKKAMSLLYKLLGYQIPVKIAPDELSYLTSGIRLHDIFDEPFMDISTPRMTEAGKNIKRALDVSLSFLALLTLSLPMAVIAIMVKRSSKGPVIYSQERIGYRNKPFNIYKFRSMRVDAETDGPQLSSPTDSRVTPFGRILRKYRLDELPQFWNVFKGDMSLVGPRPERRYFIDRLGEVAPWYPMLLQVRPGITSWGIVKKGYCSTIEEMKNRSRYDLVYVSEMSLAVDFKILVYTIKTVITGKGM